jgi:hypothetical protein
MRSNISLHVYYKNIKNNFCIFKDSVDFIEEKTMEMYGAFAHFAL